MTMSRPYLPSDCPSIPAFLPYVNMTNELKALSYTTFALTTRLNVVNNPLIPAASVDKRVAISTWVRLG